MAAEIAQGVNSVVGGISQSLKGPVCDVPDFDSLPSVDGQPQGNAWGLWGKDDQLGSKTLPYHYASPDL